MFKTDPKQIPGPSFFKALQFRSDAIDFPRRMLLEYGDVVSMVRGREGTGIYLIGRPDLAEHVLVANRDNYMKDQILRSLRVIFGDSILVSEGEKWRRNRRLMAPAFHRRAIASYAETMAECAERAMQRLPRGEPFSIQRLAMETTLDIVLGCMFSAPLGDRAQVVADGVEGAIRYADLVVRMTGKVPLWLPLPRVIAVKKAMKDIGGVVDEIVEQRRAEGVERDDLLGLLLAARDEEGAQLSDDQIREECITLLLAGHETTALLITYTMQLLGRFPYALEPVLDELENVLGGRTPTFDDVPKLTELDRLIKESLRLYPPAAIIGRTALGEDELDGFRIMPGSMVNIPIWSFHHDPRNYRDPWRFDPQRWTKNMERELPRFAFVPFGGGNRICIGDAFAKLEAKIVLATWLQRLRFNVLDRDEPELELSITMRPTTPVRAIARDRRR